MANRITFLLLLAFSLLLTQCAHKTYPEPAGYQVSAFWSSQSELNKIRQKFLGSLAMHLVSGGKSARGNGQVVVQDEKTRLELRGPLGRTQFLVTRNGKAFLAQYPTQKKAFKDNSAGERYLSAVVGVPISFENLIALSLGDLSVLSKKKKFTRWKWDGEVGKYRGELDSVLGNVRVWVDPVRNLVTRVELDSKKGQLEVDYSTLKECCADFSKQGIRLAHSVEVKNPANDTWIGLNWKRFSKLPKSVPSRAFSVTNPKGFDMVSLK